MKYPFLAFTTMLILAFPGSADADDGHDPLANGLGSDIEVTPGSAWEISDGVLSPVAGEAMAFAYTTKIYGNFDLTLDVYPVGHANSGIFVRCKTPEEFSPEVCYEFNVWDAQENPDFRTGSIVRVSPPQQTVETEDKWNTLRIRLEGAHLQFWVNGVLTNDIMNSEYQNGHIAFQYGGKNSMVRFRNIRIQELP